jgi:hypothetical protein
MAAVGRSYVVSGTVLSCFDSGQPHINRLACSLDVNSEAVEDSLGVYGLSGKAHKDLEPSVIVH